MALAGVGVQFRRWSGSAWVPLAEVNSIEGPTMSRDFIDTTALDTVGGYRTYITGFRDAGDVTLNMNFTRTTYDAMIADFESSLPQNYEIVIPDDDHTSIEFEGYVTEVPLSISPDDKITANVTIKVSGQPSVNSGSGPAPT